MGATDSSNIASQNLTKATQGGPAPSGVDLTKVRNETLPKPADLALLTPASANGTTAAAEAPASKPASTPAPSTDTPKPPDLALLKPANGEKAPETTLAATAKAGTETTSETAAKPAISGSGSKLPEPGAGRTSETQAEAMKNNFLGALGIKSPSSKSDPAAKETESSKPGNTVKFDGKTSTTAELAQRYSAPSVSLERQEITRQEESRNASSESENRFASASSRISGSTSSVADTARELDPQLAERAEKLGIPTSEIDKMSLSDLQRALKAVDLGLQYSATDGQIQEALRGQARFTTEMKAAESNRQIRDQFMAELQRQSPDGQSSRLNSYNLRLKTDQAAQQLRVDAGNKTASQIQQEAEKNLSQLSKLTQKA